MLKGEILTIKSTIICPHGGNVILFTSNVKAAGQGSFVLLETDIHPIVGCPFTIGPKYSPCVKVEWKAGHTDALIDDKPVLCQQSIGTCYNAEGAPQGIAVIVAP